MFVVADIVNNCCGDNRGMQLVERLKRSQPMSRDDRVSCEGS